MVNSEVTAVCADGTARKARADSRGVASFGDSGAGECRITVVSPGFKEWRGTGAGSVPARLELGVRTDSVGVKPKPAVRRFVDWLTSCGRGTAQKD